MTNQQILVITNLMNELDIVQIEGDRQHNGQVYVYDAYDHEVEIDPDGTTIYYKNGVHHREGDKPAWIGVMTGTICPGNENGLKFGYYKYGFLHRDVGPAWITWNGEEEYWKNGVHEPSPN